MITASAGGRKAQTNQSLNTSSTLVAFKNGFADHPFEKQKCLALNIAVIPPPKHTVYLLILSLFGLWYVDYTDISLN